MSGRLLLLLLVFSSVAHSARSQSDYRKGFIVTSAYDTVRGFVNYREGAKAYKECDFKPAENAAPVSYKPGQLTGYGFVDNAYFVSRTVEVEKGKPETVFIEVLVNGPVSLYKYYGGFFMEKADGRLMWIAYGETRIENESGVYVKKSNRHIGIVNMMLYDCEAIRHSVERLTLSEKHLTNLVERYNSCVGTTAVVYKEKKSWLKADVGLLTGVNYSTLTFSSPYGSFDLFEVPLTKSTSPLVGVSIDVSSPRLNERISLHIEGQYLKASHTAFVLYENGSTTNRNYLSYAISQVKVPVAFRYTFAERKFTPYVNAGASATFQVKASSIWKLESESFNTVTTQYEDPLPMGNKQFGVWGGMGGNIAVLPKFSAFVELRYEWTNGVIDRGKVHGEVMTSAVTNIQLVIGLKTK
ncbi:outer membrane beta-barrel protein [Chryseolinea lacunae]|uniref:PorT family protein n=1 Tax=Chryseolinea lacunae TaxID=2801331 RepID=A0ABS1KWA6_9BACT|nr:outer membrane beta-barrel protein [Chryseolinea lacunae]MBL0743473.1 PorT family protein [Chryseolinea lacunae]